MPDKPAAPPNISLATVEHAAGITPTDAVKMQLQAQKHRRVADPPRCRGRTGRCVP